MIYWYCNNCGYVLMVEVDVFLFELLWVEIFEVINVFGEDLFWIENFKVILLFVSSCLERFVKFDFLGEVKLYVFKYYLGICEWVFSYVEDWFLDCSFDLCIFIIIGNVGMGKLVIVVKFCNKMKECKVFGGVYFC